jgi:hypothetical protein
LKDDMYANARSGPAETMKQVGRHSSANAHLELSLPEIAGGCCKALQGCLGTETMPFLTAMFASGSL